MLIVDELHDGVGKSKLCVGISAFAGYSGTAN